MATIPIYNPQIPFLGQIPGKMRIGSTLKIRAKLHGYHNRCNIFIQSGAALRPRDDVVFHLAIRGDERAIVRNYFKDQAWGSEERYGGYPIHGTESFEIGITAEPNHFRININNHPFCTYSYRLSVDLAEFISVDGQCSIEYVTSDSAFPTYPMHPTPAYPPVHAHPPIHISSGFPVNHYPPAPVYRLTKFSNIHQFNILFTILATDANACSSTTISRTLSRSCNSILGI
ncbi:hypothetical protein ACKWTF_013555 [Chironomus riparius]